MMTKLLKSITSSSWDGDESRLEKLSSSDDSSVEREQLEAAERAAPPEGPCIETLEELHHHAFRLLSNTADPHRLERTRRMLERYTGDDWRLWKQRFSSSSAADAYGRSAVWGHTGCFQLLTLTWTPGCSSPIHNHPCERCFLLPLQGRMAERRYHVCEETKEVKEFLYTRLQHRRAYWMDDSIGWHAVSNEGDECAVSLHLYIPEIRKCKIVNPRTYDICWCVCPSTTRNTLPAASVRLFEIVAAAVRASQSSGTSLVSSSTFSSTPEGGRVSPSLGLACVVDARATGASSVAAAGGSGEAGSAEQHALGSCTLPLQGGTQQRLLTLLVQAFQSDAEAELQQVLAGGESKSAANVSLFSALLRPFSYYYDCAAALPPAACAAVLMHDLMLERNARPLADGAALQQISLVLLLALTLSNNQPQESAPPFAESSAGILPRPRGTRSSGETACRAAAKTVTPAAVAAVTNAPTRAGGASATAASAAAAGGAGSRRARDGVGHNKYDSGTADAEKNRRDTLQRKASAPAAATNANAPRRFEAVLGAERRGSLPLMRCLTRSRSSSRNTRRRSSGEDSLLRMQLQEAAMRAVEAYSNTKSSRVWDGWQEAPQLACVGRLLAAQLLLCESDKSYATSAASSGKAAFQNTCASGGHCSSAPWGALCCCCSSGYCSGCMTAVASPVILVLRIIDQAMLFHLASFLGWEKRVQSTTLSGRRCTSALTKGATAEADAARKAKAAGRHGGLPKGHEEEGARMGIAEQFLFPPSSLSADRGTRSNEAGLSQRNSGTNSRTSNERAKAPSVFYRNSTRSGRGKAALLDLLRASMAEGGAVAAQKDLAVQEAAANVVQNLLEDVACFSPLRDVVCCSLLRCDDNRETVAGESSRLTTRGERCRKYETHQADVIAWRQLATRTCLQRELHQTLGVLEHRQSIAASDFFDVGTQRRSSDRLSRRTSSHENDPAPTHIGRRTGSLLSGWMGAVKKRLGITGACATQRAPLSSSDDSIPCVSGLVRDGSHRTVHPLTRDSSAAEREVEPQAAGDREAVVELREEKGQGAPEPQQTRASPRRNEGYATPSPPAAAGEKRGCYDTEGGGCCEGAAAARKAEKDAFAACWLRAKEEHLALFRVLVAALHAFFSQETTRPRDLGSRKHDRQPTEMEHHALGSQPSQQQAEGNGCARVHSTIPRSQKRQTQLGVVAEGGVEGHQQDRGCVTEQAHEGEEEKLEGLSSGRNADDTAGSADATEEDLLCVYHFVAKHLDTTPYIFSVYCSEADVAQLTALRRAVQLFEGECCPRIGKKVNIEVIRATVDGLLDVQDLCERLSSWRQNNGEVRASIAAGSGSASFASDTGRSSPSKINSAAGEIERGNGRELDEGCSDSADATPAFNQSTGAGCPLLVCCSAGRAGGVQCGFDSFVDLTRLCSQHGVWLHVDASMGAAFLLPQEQPFRKYFEGINGADSLLWGFSPPLLGQTAPSGASPRSRQKTASACTPPSFPLCTLPVASSELIESVWEDAFPLALLSRHPAAFFLSNSFSCCCSCVDISTQTDRSVGLAAPNDAAGIPCGAILQAETGTGSRETQNPALLQKREGGETVVCTSYTTCVASSKLDSCLSPPPSGSHGYSLGELHAAEGSVLSGDARTLPFSTSGNAASSKPPMLQHCDKLLLLDPHAEGEEQGKSGGPCIDNNTRSSAVRDPQGEGPRLSGVAGAREVIDLSCRDRGVVLAHWCGAGRKVVGLGFSIWCYWKKLGDVGVANRARQVYLHCRRLEVFARNFPFRLKPAEYPMYAKGEHRDTESLESTAGSRRFVRGSGTFVTTSSSEDDNTDDVAGGYDIDDRVTFDYEYARLHEASVLPLVADAALLLGLPESVVTEQSAALRYASAASKELQGRENERGAGKKMYHARTTGDRNAACPFQLCLRSNEDGRARRWTSPCTLSFRWSHPGWWLHLKAVQCLLPDAAVAAEKQPTVHCIDDVTRKDLEGRLAMCLKSLLDTLKKREADVVVRGGPSSLPAGERSSHGHTAVESTAYVSIRAAGQAEHVTTHNEGEIESGSGKRSRAAIKSEQNEDSDGADFSSESPPPGEDEEGASTATKLPSFTLLSENFLVGIGGARRSDSAGAAQGSFLVDQKVSPADTVGSPFLTISLLDPRMTEDEGYSLLCLIDRLGELLWSSSGACTGSGDVPLDTLSPAYSEFLHRDLAVSPPMPRYVP